MFNLNDISRGLIVIAFVILMSAIAVGILHRLGLGRSHSEINELRDKHSQCVLENAKEVAAIKPYCDVIVYGRVQ